MELLLIVVVIVLIGWIISLYISKHDSGSNSANNYPNEYTPSPQPVQRRSRLNQRESNRLAAFCKSPKLYSSGSDKANGKIRYLMSVSHKFNDRERQDFDEAFLVWKAHISKNLKQQ